MDRSYLGRLTTANSERVLLALTHQQHLHPARSVAQTVQAVCKAQGFPESVGERALHDLAIHGQTRAGRLSRRQIHDLAEKLESAWQTELADRLRLLEPH